jgi:hypothetical protein
MRSLQGGRHFQRRAMENFRARLLGGGRRVAIQGVCVEGHGAVDPARLGIRAAAAAPKNAAFLLQQVQCTAHGGPRHPIARYQIRLARQRAR